MKLKTVLLQRLTPVFGVVSNPVAALAVEVPVYKEGDWWVFRVKEDRKRPWNTRVTYKNGKFESDDPAF